MTEEFARPDIVRPPSEHASYYLPLTAGCSNSACSFCASFGSKLRIRGIADVKKEIDTMDIFIRKGIQVSSVPAIVYAVLQGWDGKKIFLQDGDALVYPYPKLFEVLEYLNKKFPDIERIASYATPQDILRRSIDELEVLKEHKIGILYMGVESGADEVLGKVHKGVNHNQIVEAGCKVKEAGIILSVTVILGLAGYEGSEKHVRETARILTELDPDYAGALTLTLVPGTPLYQKWKQGEFSVISPFDSLRELKMIIERSNFTDCFFSSMHVSNYLSIRGTLPYDKERMLIDLEDVLVQKDHRLLRPEFLRGL